MSKITSDNYTSDSIKQYYSMSADIEDEFRKLLHEAEKNFKDVTKDLRRAKVKALRQAEMLLVSVGGTKCRNSRE
jgi:hypothetical protein